MARVTYVKKARKDQGSCYKCSTPIRQGDSYKWFANRIGRSSIRKNYCDRCAIKPSDKTTSHHLGALWGATENAEESLGADGLALTDVEEILNDTADQVREVAEGYEESAQNMIDGFGHETYQSEELTGNAEMLNEFADELESQAAEVAGLEDPDADEEEIKEEIADPELSEDELKEAIEVQRDERRTAAITTAEEALANCPM